MRDVYLYYDPISSGYIGILPEGPLVILVEVFDTLKLVWLKVVPPHFPSGLQECITEKTNQVLDTKTNPTIASFKELM